MANVISKTVILISIHMVYFQCWADESKPKDFFEPFTGPIHQQELKAKKGIKTDGAKDTLNRVGDSLNEGAHKIGSALKTKKSNKPKKPKKPAT